MTTTNEPPTQSKVILHIYEVPKANQYIKLFSSSLGVYHTGVEVYGKEYSFGGHPHDSTGIFVTPPKDIKSLSVSDTFTYKESKTMATTKKSEEEIKKIVDEMGAKDFKGKNYNLIRRNCNHFSDAFCKKICGKKVPEWVNKLMEIAKEYPQIEAVIPKEYITPVALEKKLKKEKNQKKKSVKQKTTKSSANNKQKTDSKDGRQKNRSNTGKSKPISGTESSEESSVSEKETFQQTLHLSQEDTSQDSGPPNTVQSSDSPNSEHNSIPENTSNESNSTTNQNSRTESSDEQNND